jgi:hypothetical protein
MTVFPLECDKNKRICSADSAPMYAMSSNFVSGDFLLLVDEIQSGKMNDRPGPVPGTAPRLIAIMTQYLLWSCRIVGKPNQRE